MGFTDWFTISPKSHPLVDRHEEVTEAIHEDLAGRLQDKLRLRLDQGVDLRTAMQAQAVRVAAEGNRLVISEKKQEAVLKNGGKRVNFDDLFSLSSGVPEVLDGGRIAFRSMTDGELFNSQQWRDDVVDRTVQELMQQDYVDVVEQAARKVALEHPTDKVVK